MHMDRQLAAQFAQETVEILEVGGYSTADGHVVDIRDVIEHAVAGTCSYPPETAVRFGTRRRAPPSPPYGLRSRLRRLA